MPKLLIKAGDISNYFQEVFSMKKMNSFREWLLSAANAASTPIQRRLAALTRFDRNRLANAAYEP